MRAFFTELRRRNVFKVAVVYAVMAWLLVQVATAVEEPLRLPPWFDTIVIAMLVIGFPLALVIAWAFELTPKGLRRTESTVEAEEETVREPADHDPGEATVTAKGRPSIAVMPFVNMSSDPEQEYFSDGIAEELLNQLARVQDLHVAGRTSSFSFKGKDEDLREIARKLNVAHILEGSVRKSGSRVRVTAQLIKASDGYHLWSQSYDRELNDIFAIQDEIARAVTGALSIALGVGDTGVSTRNVEAYEAFLEGRANYTRLGREGYLLARRHLERAIKLDPGFVEAWSLLASVGFYGATVWVPDQREAFLDRFESAATHAASIAPDAVDPLHASALLEAHRLHWSMAEQLLTRAVERAPSDTQVLMTMGSLMSDVGRVSEGLAYYRQAADLEPLAMLNAQLVGVGLELTGDLKGSTQQFERAVHLKGDPSGAASVMLVAALARGDRSRIDEVVALILGQDMVPALGADLLRVMHAQLDDPAGALRSLREFSENPAFKAPFAQIGMALWASYFGDDELALEFVEFGVLSGKSLPRLIWRSIHRKMRQLPAFKDLLRELKLVDYWRETGHWGDYVRPVGDDDFECIG